jgi:amidase
VIVSDPNGTAAADSLAYRSASTLVAMLADGEVSAAALLEAAIARIEALDGPINAVVVRDFERARVSAREADAALRRGERRPLLGLPMTVKESFSIVGLPTTWGNPAFKNWMPVADSLVVSRLKAAGAVILGKTNVPFMLADNQSYNDIYGTTNNPWDVSRTPGGSSGGSAAALAAGFVPLELGSDLGGSLRIPAHFCGVYAHRPSLGLLPMRGSGPPQVPVRPDQVDFAVPGPMARSARDLSLALDVLAGPDALTEGKAYRLALPRARHATLRDFRVLLLDEHPLCPTAGSLSVALNDLADHLSRAGCRVARHSPLLPDLAEEARLFRTMLGAFFSASIPEANYRLIAEGARSLDKEDQGLGACWLRGMTLSHRDWLSLTRARSRIAQQWRELFDVFDIVLCPVMPTTAFVHDHTPDQRDRHCEVDGVDVSHFDRAVWLGTSVLSGLPATAAPIALSAGGLPIGVQIIGGYLEDRTTIGFAELLEQVSVPRPVPVVKPRPR